MFVKVPLLLAVKPDEFQTLQACRLALAHVAYQRTRVRKFKTAEVGILVSVGLVATTAQPVPCMLAAMY